MNHKDNDVSADAIMAVELNADDLADLSRAHELELARLQAEHSNSAQLADDASYSTTPAVAKRTLSLSMLRLSGVAAGIGGVAILASIAFGAHYAGARYKSSGDEPATRVSTLAWTPIPERAESVEVEIEPEIQQPPTLFANPFDESEVFELPPGTTKEEARDIVAQLLIERARERVRR